MGLKRGGFGIRTARLASKAPLKADPAKTRAWQQNSRTGLGRTGLAGGSGPKRSAPPADKPKTPQQQRAAAKQAAWPKVRDVVLERDDWTCVRCGRSDLRLEVHHRRHRSQGGLDVPSNLVALCGWGNHTGCHGWAHGPLANSEGAAVGVSVPWGSEPDEHPALYPDGVRYLLDDDGGRAAA